MKKLLLIFAVLLFTSCSSKKDVPYHQYRTKATKNTNENGWTKKPNRGGFLTRKRAKCD